MRVLVVNGFSSSTEGQKSFQSFFVSIKEAFSHQKLFNLTHIEFVVVDSKSIDEYLYEINTGYLATDAEKLFDHLDFIFIDGDANLLPWYKRASKFLILLRMAKKTHKIVFAGSMAMQMYVFLCACNFQINQVINGNGKGSSLAKIHSMERSAFDKLTLGDVFLDNSTGDIYSYDIHQEAFFPIANAGIHNHKAAQDNHVLSRAMLKSFTYVARATSERDQPCKGKSTETTVRIYKQYVQHWLTKGLGFREFLVPNLNAWDVHPINATEKENVFTVLAESERGPQIIIHQNFVGVQFHVNPRYPETLDVLRNFVMHMMKVYQSENERLDLPLASVTYMRPAERPNAIAGGGTDSGLHTNTAMHSGYAFSLRSGEPLTVRNNATTSELVKLKTMKSTKETPITEDSSSSQTSLEEASGSVTSLNKASFIRNKYKSMEYPDHFTLVKASDVGLSVEELDGLQPAWKSKKEIRQMLHPGYNIHSMPKLGTVVSGTNLTLSKNDFQVYEKPLIKVLASPRPYCRYNREFKQFDEEERKNILTKRMISPKSIRASDTPYIEPERLRIRELNSNREKWVCNKDFRRVTTSHGFTRPSTTNPSTPLSTNPIRSNSKGRWRGSPFPQL
mmetsp:Transcript_7935/g.15428  ORF Transcript_7935/g.15428 Transcript_7935/m.15428 type:complete len:620 (-) Transcript_7935:28-1887(-)